MSTLLKPLLVREELLKRNVRIFTPQEFKRIFSTSSYQSKYFLERQVHEGLLLRIKQGLYTLKTDQPSEEEIANFLYRPSYISFEYALSYYNLIPEAPYTVTSATTKPTRLFTTQHQAFSYRTIKKEAYTGYLLEKKHDRAFLIADPEKALVDYLYFATYEKKLENERLLAKLKKEGYYRTKIIKREKLLRYTALYKRSSLTAFVNKFIA